MEKLCTKTIDSCGRCPNVMCIEPISPHGKDEFRCKISRYRNNVFRLIHKHDNDYMPEWCPLEDVKILELPF